MIKLTFAIRLRYMALHRICFAASVKLKSPTINAFAQIFQHLLSGFSLFIPYENISQYHIVDQKIILHVLSDTLLFLLRRGYFPRSR